MVELQEYTVILACVLPCFRCNQIEYIVFGRIDTILYISDPQAIHHILVKDQYIFEETSSFIAYRTLSLCCMDIH